jgi:thiopeptide-type bacteriocin biosynthesis protein
LEDQLCLFTLLYAPRERHEEILAGFVTPIARDLRGEPALDSLFFARYNVPSWQVRFRILGRPDWISGPVLERVQRDLETLQASGTVESVELAQYDRETERYGGEEGMALAEQLFLHDSLAILDFLELDRQDRLEKSRREVSLLMTERLAGLLRFDREQRTAFYQFGQQWPHEMGAWNESEIATIEAKYQEVKPGLQDLFTGEQAQDPEALWGGAEAARIAARWIEDSRPVAEAILEAHAAGRIQQDLNYLTWSYAHMSANRMGVDATPEALLRYFMYRLYQDGGGAP